MMEKAISTNVVEEVKEKAESLSFDLFGIADPMSPILQRAPEGRRPQDYLPTVKSVIALGMRLIDPVLQTTPSGIYSKHYDTVNEALNSGAYQLVKWLEDKGYRSMTFPETDSYGILWEQYNAGYEVFVPCFNHMGAAVSAGLGKMGTCGVVLNPQYGPRQRWISVIAEALLSSGRETEEEICLEKRVPGSCRKCVDACPVEAVNLNGKTNVRKCWINWTGKRDKGLACGICIKVCPVGRQR